MSAFFTASDRKVRPRDAPWRFRKRPGSPIEDVSSRTYDADFYSKETSKRGGMRISRIVFATVVVAGGAGCESAADSLFCESAGCQWPAREWDAVSALAAPADWKPPEDRSNKYVGNELAQKLGHKFFFDKSWSGPSNQVDVLRRPVGYARAAPASPPTCRA